MMPEFGYERFQSEIPTIVEDILGYLEQNGDFLVSPMHFYFLYLASGLLFCTPSSYLFYSFFFTGGLEQEGLFRVSARVDQVEELRNEYRKPGKNIFCCLSLR